MYITVIEDFIKLDKGDYELPVRSKSPLFKQNDIIDLSSKIHIHAIKQMMSCSLTKARLLPADVHPVKPNWSQHCCLPYPFLVVVVPGPLVVVVVSPGT